jgi:hypothetical protein
VRAVFLERARQRKFSKPMADHVIERRDQVLIGVFWFVLFAFWIFS